MGLPNDTVSGDKYIGEKISEPLLQLDKNTLYLIKEISEEFLAGDIPEKEIADAFIMLIRHKIPINLYTAVLSIHYNRQDLEHFLNMIKDSDNFLFLQESKYYDTDKIFEILNEKLNFNLNINTICRLFLHLASDKLSNPDRIYIKWMQDRYFQIMNFDELLKINESSSELLDLLKSYGNAPDQFNKSIKQLLELGQYKGKMEINPGIEQLREIIIVYQNLNKLAEYSSVNGEFPEIRSEGISIIKESVRNLMELINSIVLGRDHGDYTDIIENKEMSDIFKENSRDTVKSLIIINKLQTGFYLQQFEGLLKAFMDLSRGSFENLGDYENILGKYLNTEISNLNQSEAEKLLNELDRIPMLREIIHSLEKKNMDSDFTLKAILMNEPDKNPIFKQMIHSLEKENMDSDFILKAISMNHDEIKSMLLDHILALKGAGLQKIEKIFILLKHINKNYSNIDICNKFQKALQYIHHMVKEESSETLKGKGFEINILRNTWSGIVDNLKDKEAVEIYSKINNFKADRGFMPKVMEVLATYSSDRVNITSMEYAFSSLKNMISFDESQEMFIIEPDLEKLRDSLSDALIRIKALQKTDPFSESFETKKNILKLKTIKGDIENIARPAVNISLNNDGDSQGIIMLLDKTESNINEIIDFLENESNTKGGNIGQYIDDKQKIIQDLFNEIDLQTRPVPMKTDQLQNLLINTLLERILSETRSAVWGINLSSHDIKGIQKKIISLAGLPEGDNALFSKETKSIDKMLARYEDIFILSENRTDPVLMRNFISEIENIIDKFFNYEAKVHILEEQKDKYQNLLRDFQDHILRDLYQKDSNAIRLASNRDDYIYFPFAFNKEEIRGIAFFYKGRDQKKKMRIRSMKIIINSKTLGMVMVNAALSRNNINLLFATDKEETVDLINANMETLSSILNKYNENIKVDAVRVVLLKEFDKEVQDLFHDNISEERNKYDIRV